MLKTIGPTDLIATLGFSCYIFWELLGVFEALPFAAPSFPDDWLLFLRVWLFFALALGFLVLMKMTRRVKRQPQTFLRVGVVAAVVVLSIALSSSVLPQPPLWLGVIAWVGYGISLTGLMAAWAGYFSTRCNKRTPFIITVSYTMGFGMFFLISLIAPSPNATLYQVVGIVVAASTSGFLAFLIATQPEMPYTAEEEACLAEAEPGQRAADDTSRAEPPRAPFARTLHAMAYGVSYGFTITFLQSTGPASAAIGALGGLVGCGIAVLALSRNHLAKGRDIRRITFIPVAVALLFLPVGPPLSYILCSLPIIAATIYTAVTSWVDASLKASEGNYNPVAVFTASKWPGWVGFFLGTLASVIVIEVSPSLFTIVVAGLVAFICVSFAVFELRIYEERHDGEQDSDEVSSLTELVDGRGSHEKRFQTRCDDIVRDCGLSPREAEVFRLLAKGRNAEYISQELCIAKPTTKTHIQHVYQKLTINSHQELIDLIDDKG